MAVVRGPSISRAPGSTVSAELLAGAVRGLDDGSRALLDLSLRRGLPDDTIASVVRTDPFHLAWRRARLIERLASQVRADGPAELALVRTALMRLPDDAWMAPRALPPGDPAPHPAAGGLRDAVPEVEPEVTRRAREKTPEEPVAEAPPARPARTEPDDLPGAEALELPPTAEARRAPTQALVPRRPLPDPPPTTGAIVPAHRRALKAARFAAPAVRRATRGAAVAGAGIAVGLLLGRRRGRGQLSIRA